MCDKLQMYVLTVLLLTIVTAVEFTIHVTYTYHIRSAIFDGENIDGQHLRPPVLAILLETIERENFNGLPA